MINTEKILLCADLDRTLLPNGDAPESSLARPLFSTLAARPEIILTYVSGRDKSLVEQAIDHYALPQPDYVIADVGASIYRASLYNWDLDQDWRKQIAADWHGKLSWDIHSDIGNIEGLHLQSLAKQSDYKLSYQVTSPEQLDRILPLLYQKLDNIDIRHNCIVSIDETNDQGLVDVLPHLANKRLAIDFLVDQLNIPDPQVVFSGDSGNDLDALVSNYNAILVANALPEVKALAQQKAIEYGNEQKLYLATGLSEALNGNYAAGIIEGILHYYPFVSLWLKPGTTQ